MNATAPKLIEFNQALDGARVLWRFYTARLAPTEGWVREFNRDGSLVRISRTNKKTDAGIWHRVYDLRCEGVLEPAKAPVTGRQKVELPKSNLPDASDELELGDGA